MKIKRLVCLLLTALILSVCLPAVSAEEETRWFRCSFSKITFGYDELDFFYNIKLNGYDLGPFFIDDFDEDHTYELDLNEFFRTNPSNYFPLGLKTTPFVFELMDMDENPYVLFSGAIESSKDLDGTVYIRGLKNEVSVVFHYDKPSEEDLTVKVYEGEKVSQPKTPESYGGYRIDWCTDPELKNKYDFNNEVYGDLELYAKPVKLYSVTVAGDGSYGTTVPSVQYAAEGETVTLTFHPESIYRVVDVICKFSVDDDYIYLYPDIDPDINENSFIMKNGDVTVEVVFQQKYPGDVLDMKELKVCDMISGDHGAVINVKNYEIVLEANRFGNTTETPVRLEDYASSPLLIYLEKGILFFQSQTFLGYPQLYPFTSDGTVGDAWVVTDIQGNIYTLSGTTSNSDGHDWNDEPVFSWADDGTAQATFTCTRDASHTDTVKADITGEPQVTAPAGTDHVKAVYPVAASFNGQQYTGSLEKIIRPSAPVTYSCEGDPAEWIRGAGGSAVFRFVRSEDDDLTFAAFSSLDADGTPVDEKYYTVTKGSAVITLDSEFLDTLAEGSHTLTANFADGKAEAVLTIKVPERIPPETGVPGMIRPVILTACILTAFLYLPGRKQKRHS